MEVINLAQLEDDLQRDEGFKPYAYKDSEGYLTIGIGTLIDQRKGGGINLDEAKYLLQNRIRTKLQDMDRRMSWWRTKPEHVQRALANMAYQLGVDGLLGFKNTLSLIQQDKFSEAADNALKSLWARQTPNRAKAVTDTLRGAS